MGGGGLARAAVSFFRGILAILAGFLSLPFFMWVALAVVAPLWPEATGSPAPSVAFMRLNLGLTGLMAALSAVVTATIAPPPRYLWVLVLSFLVFLGGLVVGVTQSGAALPTWYLLGLPLVSGLSIALGGWAWLAWRARLSGPAPGRSSA